MVVPLKPQGAGHLLIRCDHHSFPSQALRQFLPGAAAGIAADAQRALCEESFPDLFRLLKAILTDPLSRKPGRQRIADGKISFRVLLPGGVLYLGQVPAYIAQDPVHKAFKTCESPLSRQFHRLIAHSAVGNRVHILDLIDAAP